MRRHRLRSRRAIVFISCALMLAAASCTPKPGGIDTSKLDNASRNAIRQSVTLVTEARKLKASDMEVLSVEAKDWPDASLGLPEPGKVYAQMITPGHIVTVKIPDGTILEAHTSSMRAVLTH